MDSEEQYNNINYDDHVLNMWQILFDEKYETMENLTDNLRNFHLFCDLILKYNDISKDDDNYDNLSDLESELE